MDDQKAQLSSVVRGLLGAIVGAVIGAFLFDLLLGYGLYAMIMPGALVGFGASLASRAPSLPVGVFAGLTGLAIGIYMEWKYFPFVDDESLIFFLKNFFQVNMIHIVMIIAGGVAGFIFGKGRESVRLTQTP